MLRYRCFPLTRVLACAALTLAASAPFPACAEIARDRPGFVVPAPAEDRWRYDQELECYRNRFATTARIVMLTIQHRAAPAGCATTEDLAVATRQWADSVLAASAPEGRSLSVDIDTTLGGVFVRYHLRRSDVAAADVKDPGWIRETRGYRRLHPDPRLGYVDLRFTWVLRPGVESPVLAEPDLAWVRGLKVVPAGTFVPEGDVTITLPRGATPAGVASGFGSLWVTLPDQHRILRLDPGTGRILDSLAVGKTPTAIVTTPDAVWVGDPSQGRIHRIEPAGLRVTGTAKVSGAGGWLVVAAGALWTAHGSRPKLYRVDPASLAVTALDLGALMPSKRWLALLGESPPKSVDGLATDGRRIAVSWSERGGIAWFEPGDTLPRRPLVVDGLPEAPLLAFGSLWVLDRMNDEVLKIDLERDQIVARIRVEDRPHGLARCGDEVWVYSDPVTRIDSATGWRAGPGPSFWGDFLASDSMGVWVALREGGLVRYTTRPPSDTSGLRAPTPAKLGADTLAVAAALGVGGTHAARDTVAARASSPQFAQRASAPDSTAIVRPAPAVSQRRGFSDRHPGLVLGLSGAAAVGWFALLSSAAYADDRGETLAAVTAASGILGQLAQTRTMRGFGVGVCAMLGLALGEYLMGHAGASENALFLTNMVAYPALVIGTGLYDQHVQREHERLKADR